MCSITWPHPNSAAKLSQAYKVWRRLWRGDLQRRPLFDYVAALLGQLHNVEEYVAPLVPAGSADTLEDVVAADEDESEEVLGELGAFRDVIKRWHAATLLPIDQLVLTLAQEVFTAPADLALAHKLALVLRQVADENPEWRLPELIPILNEIARNERRFIGFSDDDAGFNPDDYRGIVIVSTMHKAKGLEWDRVYLMSVNNYDYPSNQPNDRYISERWFIRAGLNLEAEALAQLDAALNTESPPAYQEGAATLQAAPRLRSRAAASAVCRHHPGSQGAVRHLEQRPAWQRGSFLAFTALWHWWRGRHAEQDQPS